MGNNGNIPLFGTREGRVLSLFRLYAVSIFIAIFFICFYRVRYIPVDGRTERWAWIGTFLAELWFTFYFFVTVVVKWSPVYRYTFKDRLYSRYGEENLPGVDIFVCTADPEMEPPIMVINTVLSVMAYDYPTEKLSVYLSDDGGSDLTFYALLEASRFAEVWLPFCRKLNVEPRSPEAYFLNTPEPVLDADSSMAQEWLPIKKSYEDMKMRIETITKLGKIPADRRKEHKGFREWDFVSSRYDHHNILQILIDGREPNAMDIEGKSLPTLVYLAREKRPQYHHKFKAGALNALIRVSSNISNAPFILNVDCDMHSNNSEAVKDALCFLLDEEKGHEIAFVQYPQNFGNLTKNDIYGGSLRVIMETQLPGFDGIGGPCYIGTGCLHRRKTLCGLKYNKVFKVEWRAKKTDDDRKSRESTSVLEENCKALASCTYEENTQWGNEVGLKYGVATEDVLTGLSIHSRGWRSVYFNPERKAFLGAVPTTLLQALVQNKRWAEGNLQILLSNKHCPFICGRQRMGLKHQVSYCIYLLWGLNCFSVLYYFVLPSLCLLRGISLFPKMSSSWCLPFLYAIFVSCAHSLVEFLTCGTGGTLRGWLNEQRMWVFRSTTSYFFAAMDYVLKLIGYSKSAFIITGKVADDHVYQRYEQEVMEFGATSPMFTIISTIALFNLFSFIVVTKKAAFDDVHTQFFDLYGFQLFLCCVLLFLNLPVYKGMFFRKDAGKMPLSVTNQSLIFALLACTVAMC